MRIVAIPSCARYPPPSNFKILDDCLCDTLFVLSNVRLHFCLVEDKLEVYLNTQFRNEINNLAACLLSTRKGFFFSKRLSLNVYIKYKVKYPRANEDDILSNNQTLTQ